MPNGVRMNACDPEIRASEDLYTRALGLIPSVTQTLAKGPEQFVRGVAPMYLQRGRGSHVFDVDGNEYLDYSMGVGPISLGYAYPAVDQAIRAQLEEGITFSLMHPLEVEVAELVRRCVPCAQAVRFSKTGCDVTSAAIRLARAFTGREKIFCCGYHGWHDWYISVTDRRAGIPSSVGDLTFTFPYNDLEALEDALDDEVAAVILEPVTFEAPKEGFLEGLKALCERKGCLLIFDEMWTGFRMALGGAQEFFGVTPDLACFSKAVANGMPLSILAGRWDVMSRLEEDVFFFTTFGGEALSLAAAKATIEEMERKRVQEHIARLGKRLRSGLAALLPDEVGCVGYDCRTLLTFGPKAGDPLVLKSFVQQELLQRGILWGGIHNISFSHAEADIDHTLTAYAEILPLLSDAIAKGVVKESLRGRPVAPVFRRTSNFHTKPVAVAEKR